MSQTPRMLNALRQFVVSKRGGVFDPKVILAFFQYDVFSAQGVDTVSCVEVTDPTPGPLRSGTRPDPTGAGMLHSE